MAKAPMRGGSRCHAPPSSARRNPATAPTSANPDGMPGRSATPHTIDYSGRYVTSHHILMQTHHPPSACMTHVKLGCVIIGP
jgi:hypothetical protein